MSGGTVRSKFYLDLAVVEEEEQQVDSVE